MKVTLFSILFFAGYIASAQQVFTTKDGAINGYDAVAYFTEAKPVKGDAKYSMKWKDATWYFSSEKNLNLFKRNPEQYAPQYGGYCAFGTSRGYKAPTQPDAWSTVDGKLYLNYNLDVQKNWSADRENLIRKADVNWKKIESE